MAIRPRGRGWQIDVSLTVDGKKRRARETFIGSKAEAGVREAVIKAALQSGAKVEDVVKVSTASLTLAEAFADCHRKYWDGTASSRQNVRYCREFMDFAGSDTPIRSLTTRQIEEYVQRMKDKGLAASTMNSKIAVISKMVTHFEEEFDRKPRVSFIKGGKNKRIRYLTDHERDGIVTYLTDRWGAGRAKVRSGTPTAIMWHDFYVFFLDTGARPSEIRELNERDLDGDVIHIWKTKSGEPRSIPLTRRSLEAFKRQCERVREQPLTGRDRSNPASSQPFGYATRHAYRAVWDEIRDFLRLSNDREFVPYVCRHDCATRLYRRTKDLLVVQQWLGHSNIQQTLTYAKLFPSALKDARDALEADVVE